MCQHYLQPYRMMMRYGSKSCASCRTVLVLLSIERSEWCSFVLGGDLANLRNYEVRTHEKWGMSVHWRSCSDKHVNCECCWLRRGFTEPRRNARFFFFLSLKLSIWFEQSTKFKSFGFELMNTLCVDWILSVLEDWESSRRIELLRILTQNCVARSGSLFSSAISPRTERSSDVLKQARKK